MKTSKSFSTKLAEAMKNDNKTTRDPNLINEAIQCDFYHEASQLIFKDFPSTISVPQILIDKIQTSIDANREEDFYSLILAYFLSYDRNDDEDFIESYFLLEIPPKNLNFALVISIFKERYYKICECVNSQITHFFPNSSKFDQNSNFFSIKALQIQFFDFLDSQSEKLHLKQSTPSKEFIFAEDRGKMCSYAKDLSDNCISFINSNNDDQFYTSICQILNSFSENLSKTIKKGENHSLSMIARENGMFFVNRINKAAKKVSEQYIKKVINNDSDSSGVLQTIQENIIQKKSVDYQESIILAELIGILFLKQDKPAKYEKFNKILGLFDTAILKFEKNFKNDKQYSSKYNSCILHPKKRNDYLLDESTETSKALIKFGRALQYVKYITESSFIDSIMHLERCVIIDGMIDPSIPSKYENEANTRFNHHLDICKKITNFLKEMKPFAFINPPLQSFEFTDEFPKYNFHPDFNLDNATITDIHSIFQQKVDLKSILPKSAMAIKIPKCMICHTIHVQRICGNCGKFVTCQKCASEGCPICHKPLPDLS